MNDIDLETDLSELRNLLGEVSSTMKSIGEFSFEGLTTSSLVAKKLFFKLKQKKIETKQNTTNTQQTHNTNTNTRT